jgi:hypothetical protein
MSDNNVAGLVQNKLKKKKGIKNCVISVQSNPANLNTLIESFRKFSKTARKGFQRNSVQFDSHTFLNVLNIKKPQ